MGKDINISQSKKQHKKKKQYNQIEIPKLSELMANRRLKSLGWVMNSREAK